MRLKIKIYRETMSYIILFCVIGGGAPHACKITGNEFNL